MTERKPVSDWDKKVRPASFRNVPFFVDSSDTEGGRRAVQFVFPARAKPFTDDLGKAPENFTIEGYLLGADYFAQRDALIAAFNVEGAGDLIHPYYGNKKVQAGVYRFKETKEQTRYVSFSVSFLEAGDAGFPSIKTDKISAIAAFADKLKAASQAAFEKVFKVVGYSQRVVDAGRGNTNDAIGGFASSTQNISNLNDSLDTVNYGIRNLRRDSNQLTNQPGNLASRFTDTIFALTGVGVDDQTSLRVLSGLTTYGSTYAAISQTTPSRVQMAANQTAMINLVQQQALANSANLAIAIEWPSFEDAQTQREILMDVVEAQMETTTDDDVFEALADLKGALAEFLPDANDDLPRLREITLGSSQPSLVVVYDLFESPTKESDLVARNHVRHPGYVPSGVPLEVLSE